MASRTVWSWFPKADSPLRSVKSVVSLCAHTLWCHEAARKQRVEREREKQGGRGGVGIQGDPHMKGKDLGKLGGSLRPSVATRPFIHTRSFPCFHSSVSACCACRRGARPVIGSLQRVSSFQSILEKCCSQADGRSQPGPHIMDSS